MQLTMGPLDEKQLTIGCGIISPFTRHPVQVAMDARVVQEVAGQLRALSRSDVPQSD